MYKHDNLPILGLIFGFIGVWGLNVIEAYVDAHFVTFDVSEDLSFSWAPTVLANQHAGLSLRLNLGWVWGWARAGFQGELGLGLRVNLKLRLNLRVTNGADDDGDGDDDDVGM